MCIIYKSQEDNLAVDYQNLQFVSMIFLGFCAIMYLKGSKVTQLPNEKEILCITFCFF